MHVGHDMTQRGMCVPCAYGEAQFDSVFVEHATAVLVAGTVLRLPAL